MIGTWAEFGWSLGRRFLASYRNGHTSCGYGTHTCGIISLVTRIRNDKIEILTSMANLHNEIECEQLFTIDVPKTNIPVIARSPSGALSIVSTWSGHFLVELLTKGILECPLPC